MILYKQIDNQLVILAGGTGSRIREETHNKPKPMIEIGGIPIMLHLMRHYNHFGVRRFIICTGYRSEVISDYFMNLQARLHDFTIDYSKESAEVSVYSSNLDWEVTVVHTGDEKVGTEGRLRRAFKYVDNFPFFCTYGDGLSDINPLDLMSFHEEHGLLGTVTITNPKNRFGVVEIMNNRVTSFKEKPAMKDFINSGFFLFNQGVKDKLDPFSMLEDSLLPHLAKSSQLNGFKHQGFWQAMDTYRDWKLLDDLWNSGMAPWKA